MKGTNKFCMIILAPNWRFFISSEKRIVWTHHKWPSDILTTKTEPWNRTVWTFASSFGTENRILKNGSCERALREYWLILVGLDSQFRMTNPITENQVQEKFPFVLPGLHRSVSDQAIINALQPAELYGLLGSDLKRKRLTNILRSNTYI